MKQAGSPPSLLVIFGITGDLSRRYLLPSLYELVRNNKLDEKTCIIGVTRGETTVDELFQKIKLDDTERDKTALSQIHDRTTMIQMDLDDPAAYVDLLDKLNSIEEAAGVCLNRLYYLSIPPKTYLSVIELLGQAGLNKSCQHNRAATRLLVEKPFGFNLESAQKLVTESSKIFSEEQIFRIDHYVAKDTVQNILKTRFSKPEFEAVWNNQHIEAIEVIAKQTIGIDGRAVFYEPLGALRDFIQSHLIQILGIITMDKPVQLDSATIHTNKQAALDQIGAVPADKVLQYARRGQYDSYRQEVNNPESVTETFAEITVFSQSERWEGVPIKLLTGKALDEHKTEILVHFKANEAIADGANTLTIDIQSPSAYQRVLLDALGGDHTIFATNQEILNSWRIVQPVLDTWASNSDDLKFYPTGSAGPA